LRLQPALTPIVKLHNAFVNPMWMIAIDRSRGRWQNSQMPIYTIAEYRVRPAGVQKVQRAIEEFVPYVKANEPGTRMYQAWQKKDDPTRFLHLFIFEDEAAHTAHSKSAAVKRFEAAYRPELDGGEVIFTDYDLIATNQKMPGD
jgi:quinol monooxygenase YgiN